MSQFFCLFRETEILFFSCIYYVTKQHKKRDGLRIYDTDYEYEFRNEYDR